MESRRLKIKLELTAHIHVVALTIEQVALVRADIAGSQMEIVGSSGHLKDIQAAGH